MGLMRKDVIATVSQAAIALTIVSGAIGTGVLYFAALANELKSSQQTVYNVQRDIYELKADVRALTEAFKGVATKEEIAKLATKEEIAKLATKEEIAKLATKEEIAKLATKEEIAKLATKEEIAKLATREEIAKLATKKELAVALEIIKEIRDQDRGPVRE